MFALEPDSAVKVEAEDPGSLVEHGDRGSGVLARIPCKPPGEVGAGSVVEHGVDGKLCALHTYDPPDTPSGEHVANNTCLTDICASIGVDLHGESASGLIPGEHDPFATDEACDDPANVSANGNSDFDDKRGKATRKGRRRSSQSSEATIPCNRASKSPTEQVGADVSTPFGGIDHDGHEGNISPSSIGAAKVEAKAIPAAKGKLSGMNLRVPTVDVTVADLTGELEKEVTWEESSDEYWDSLTENEKLEKIMEVTDRLDRQLLHDRKV